MTNLDARTFLVGSALQALITRHDGQMSETAIVERALIYADLVQAKLGDAPRPPAMTLTPDEIEKLRK
jgi:hypothetical protein